MGGSGRPGAVRSAGRQPDAQSLPRQDRRKERFEPMKEFTYVIQDPVGLHARPAGFLLRRAKNYRSSVLVKAPNGREANAAKLMALMSMGAKAGDTLTFILEGDDEEVAAADLAQYLPEIL